MHPDPVRPLTPAVDVTSTRARQVTWIAYLALGATMIVAYYRLPRAGAAQGVLLTVINASAAIAALWTASRTRGQARVVWVFLGLSMVLSTGANAPYYGYPLLTGRTLPFPSPVDAIWLLTYPCFVVALRALAKQRRRVDRTGDTLDATILVVAGVSVMWQFIIGPEVRESGIPLLAHAVSIAFPVMDLVVFAMLVRFVVTVSRRNASMRLLLGSFVVLLVADVVYSVLLSKETYAYGGPTDGLWMASYLLVGVAAVHPSASQLRTSAPATRHRVSFGRLAFLCAAVLTGPVLVVARPKELVAVAAASALSFILVMARVTGLNRELATVGAEMKTRASTDALTGLANRVAFVAGVDAALTASTGHAGTVAIVFIDLDDFKDVNDTLGHAAGDEVLRVAAARLREAVRPTDVIARLGGDEFAILLEGVHEPAVAMRTAQRAVTALAASLEVAGTSVHVGASAGLALRRLGSDPESLMREADVAMYTAKRQGKNQVALYDAALETASVARQSLKAEIGAAAARDELLIDYQPVVDLDTGQLVGVEALVRWQHPTLGLLPPSSFIDLAEQSGAIIGIGSWVMEAAAARVADWQRRYLLPTLWLSVNVSACQLEHAGFAEQVGGVLRRTGLAPGSLVVEVTESVLLDPAGGASETLDAVRRLGARVAIDDFGTGYSSLAYLGELPIDIIKIDQAFVSGDQTGRRGPALLDAIVDLAHHLRLDVIPEGIEAPHQLARLQELGCQVGQGFLMSRPLSTTAIEALLADPTSLLPFDEPAAHSLRHAVA
jgi:diguanylate cyclase (GGDEF)-like protein